jgi:hypothetical protein
VFGWRVVDESTVDGSIVGGSIVDGSIVDKTSVASVLVRCDAVKRVVGISVLTIVLLLLQISAESIKM